MRTGRAEAGQRLLLQLEMRRSACTGQWSSWSQLSTPQQTLPQEVVAAPAGAGMQEGAGGAAGGVAAPAPGQQALVRSLGLGEMWGDRGCQATAWMALIVQLTLM
jgi:hypothetical protein